MRINGNLNFEEFLISKNNLTGADIRGMCTEAALLALKNHRFFVEQKDFKKAHDLILKRRRRINMDNLYS
jgi:26S proteasome regulatory subunit T2